MIARASRVPCVADRWRGRLRRRWSSAQERPLTGARPQVHEADAAHRERQAGPERLLEGHARHEAGRQHRQGSSGLEAAADAGRRSGAQAQSDRDDRSREPLHHRRHPAAQRQRPAVRDPAGRQQGRVPVLVQLLPPDPDRSEAQALGRSRSVVLRRGARPLGRRHAGHRLDRIQGREGLDRRERQPAQRRPARRRALDAAGRRPHSRRDPDRRSEVLHEAVHVLADVGARAARRGAPGILVQREQRGCRASGLRTRADPPRRHARLHRSGAASAAASPSTCQVNRRCRGGSLDPPRVASDQ